MRIYVICTIFDENLIAVHMKRTMLYFNKPVYLGRSILDLSKSLMHDLILTILRLDMGITQNFSSPTLTLVHMKLRPIFFYKDINLDIDNALTLVTAQLIIDLELKQDLIIKYLDCLRMRLCWFVGYLFLQNA